MGLDMYLYKKRYVKNWSHTPKDDRTTVTVAKGGKLTKVDNASYVVEDCGYWRKANAIHGWFVQNVMGGDDNGATYYVSEEKLQELLDIVNQVLKASKLVNGKIANGYKIEQNPDGSLKEIPIMEDGKYIENPSVAAELLPTTSGYFFGSTEYDQWYYEDLVETKKILTEALKDEDADFEYHASW